jgi:hypothetical protein
VYAFQDFPLKNIGAGWLMFFGCSSFSYVLLNAVFAPNLSRFLCNGHRAMNSKKEFFGGVVAFDGELSKQVFYHLLRRLLAGGVRAFATLFGVGTNVCRAFGTLLPLPILFAKYALLAALFNSCSGHRTRQCIRKKPVIITRPFSSLYSSLLHANCL